jgi:hypothetical protein
MPRHYIPRALRNRVIKRARRCCEYCLIHEGDSSESHQADHIIAVKHGGKTRSKNLACACAECNRYKGTDFATIDPVKGKVILLFNPRTQRWRDHFELRGAQIVGLTATGKATVELLRLNDDGRLLERETLMADGRYPPSWMI